MFIDPSAENQAKLICEGCPVRTECLADALDGEVDFGVWGGMTGPERRLLLRRLPGVPSWRSLLQTAEFRYSRQAVDSVAADGEPARPTGQPFPAPPARDLPGQAEGVPGRAPAGEQRM